MPRCAPRRAQGEGGQASGGGPRGAVAHWWAPQIGAACGAQGSAGALGSASTKNGGTGGGARPPCDSRHKGQCMPGPAPGRGASLGAPLSAPGAAAKARPLPARSPAASANTVRGPPLVHTSMPWAGPGSIAPVTRGASVANAISPSASQAQARARRRLRPKVKRGIPGMAYGGCKLAKGIKSEVADALPARAWGRLRWPSLRAWSARCACRVGARPRRCWARPWPPAP